MQNLKWIMIWITLFITLQKLVVKWIQVQETAEYKIISVKVNVK